MEKLGPFELNKVHCVDALEGLRALPDGCIQCVVTSPPYWGLRVYPFGGDKDCRHDWQMPEVLSPSTMQVCKKCGAKSPTLGLEPTPELFIKHMVLIFREVRRVLRDDGTLWLNLGDSYGSQQGKGFNTNAREGYRNRVQEMQAKHGDIRRKTNLKPKDLCGIPWRVALALQGIATVPGRDLDCAADILAEARNRSDWELVEGVEGMLRGWARLSQFLEPNWLRSEIIWHKSNPMPESVTDRPTKAHEYIFLLTKSARYYYDQEAVREAHADTKFTRDRYKYPPSKAKKHSQNSDTNIGDSDFAQYFSLDGGRNSRTVWTIPTEPTPEAHFATFPTEIPRRCILAGTSEKGACLSCGKPWERIVDKKQDILQKTNNPGKQDLVTGWDRTKWPRTKAISTTTGWRPTCKCDASEPVPCVVLDPFGGTGKTGEMAIALGRDCIIFDINPDYVAEFAAPRIEAAVKGLTIKELEYGQGTLFGEEIECGW